MKHASSREGIAGLAVAAATWPPRLKASLAWRSQRTTTVEFFLAVGAGHRWRKHSGPPSGGIDARCQRQNLHFLASAKASQARGHCGPHQKVELREPGLQSSQKFCWGICVNCHFHVMYTGRHTAPSISCWNYSHRGPPPGLIWWGNLQ